MGLEATRLSVLPDFKFYNDKYTQNNKTMKMLLNQDSTILFGYYDLRVKFNIY